MRDLLFLKRWKIDAKARSSMADDLAAGRKTEIDYLNGELVQLADRLQRAAPVNRAIVDLIRKAGRKADLSTANEGALLESQTLRSSWIIETFDC